MPERKNSEARIRSNNKWTNANYDRINLAIPKGQKERLKVVAAAQGKSVNSFVAEAIAEKLERENNAKEQCARRGRQGVTA